MRNERKPTTPYEARLIIIPLIITPTEMAINDRLFGRPKSAAMSEPIQAPVPGRGTATNKKRDVKIATVISLFFSLCRSLV